MGMNEVKNSPRTFQNTLRFKFSTIQLHREKREREREREREEGKEEQERSRVVHTI